MPNHSSMCPETHDLDGLHRDVLSKKAEACLRLFFVLYLGWFIGSYSLAEEKLGGLHSLSEANRTDFCFCGIGSIESLAVSAKPLHFAVSALLLFFKEFPIKANLEKSDMPARGFANPGFKSDKV